MAGLLCWYPTLDAFRTLCLAPDGEVRDLFAAAKELTGAA